MYWTFEKKLALIIMLMSLAICLAIYFAVRSSFTQGFDAYLMASRMEDAQVLVEAIEQSVTTQQQWLKFKRTPRDFHDLIRNNLGSSDQGVNSHLPDNRDYRSDRHRKNKKFNRPPDQGRPRRPPPKQDPFTLLDTEKNPVFYFENYSRDWSHLPVKIGALKTVYIGIQPVQRETQTAENQFVATQNRWFLIISLCSAILFSLLSWPIANFLTQPLRKLSTAVEKLSRREFSVRADANDIDDFGKLASTFNHLAEELEQYDRRQRNWISDISHELRTPLSIMRAEIEAVEDGIRKADEKFIRSLKNETQQLNQLIENLHLLTLAESDAYQLNTHPVDLRQLIDDQIARHTIALRDKSIAFSWYSGNYSGNADDTAPPAQRSIDDKIISSVQSAYSVVAELDTGQVQRLISNLMQNSLRYTNSNGQIRCTLQSRYPDLIEIIWEDSAPGVANEHLSRLFDRLFRVEESRNRAQGGSGLGLSVCQAIIKQHHGSIDASHSELGGLKLTISLPKQQPAEKPSLVNNNLTQKANHESR